MAPGGQLGQRGHKRRDDLRGTLGKGGGGAGLGDLEQQGLQGFEELVDLLHGAPPVPAHRQVLADGPHLGGDSASAARLGPPEAGRGVRCSRPYHGGEHDAAAACAAGAARELQELSGQLDHQGGVLLAQGQELGAQHAAGRGRPRSTHAPCRRRAHGPPTRAAGKPLGTGWAQRGAHWRGAATGPVLGPGLECTGDKLAKSRPLDGGQTGGKALRKRDLGQCYGQQACRTSGGHENMLDLGQRDL